MGDRTGISWTDATWNPVTGCSRVSEGCRFCYAEALSLRQGWTSKPWTAPNAAENVKLHPDRLDMPLRWKRPRRIFVNSMSDLFHEQVPNDFIEEVFAVMSGCPHHTFQVLTKRPQRMLEWFSHSMRSGFVAGAAQELKVPMQGIPMSEWWPLKNVWLGVSVEDQRTADERIPLLLQTPAAVRWISAEPLLGPVNLHGEFLTAIAGKGWQGDPPKYPFPWMPDNQRTRIVEVLDWVVVGGESGPKARPMHPDWARSLRNQCQAAGVAFHFKQWGEWGPDWRTGELYPVGAPGIPNSLTVHQFSDGTEVYRLGKKRTGNRLDGFIWDDYPRPAEVTQP